MNMSAMDKTTVFANSARTVAKLDRAERRQEADAEVDLNEG